MFTYYTIQQSYCTIQLSLPKISGLVVIDSGYHKSKVDQILPTAQIFRLQIANQIVSIVVVESLIKSTLFQYQQHILLTIENEWSTQQRINIYFYMFIFFRKLICIRILNHMGTNYCATKQLIALSG